MKITNLLRARFKLRTDSVTVCKQLKISWTLTYIPLPPPIFQMLLPALLNSFIWLAHTYNKIYNAWNILIENIAHKNGSILLRLPKFGLTMPYCSNINVFLPIAEIMSSCLTSFFWMAFLNVSFICWFIALKAKVRLIFNFQTHTLVKGSKHEIMSFIELYSKFGFVPSASFTVLTTTCLVFALDR